LKLTLGIPRIPRKSFSTIDGLIRPRPRIIGTPPMRDDMYIVVQRHVEKSPIT